MDFLKKKSESEIWGYQVLRRIPPLAYPQKGFSRTQLCITGFHIEQSLRNRVTLRLFLCLGDLEQLLFLLKPAPSYTAANQGCGELSNSQTPWRGSN